MSEGWQHQETEGERLGKADFDPAPYAELPLRKHARAHIDTPVSPSLDIGWHHDNPPPPEPPQPRRLTRRERRLIQKHRHSIATFRRRKQRRWGLKLAGIVAASLVLVSLASQRFVETDDEGSGMSRPPPTSLAGMASPISEQSPVAALSNTPTSEPTPTPTPDPRFIGKVVCLDPGHGGSDRGYVRDANDIAPAMEEAVLNLTFAFELKARLEAHGFTVVLTRERDDSVNTDGRDVNGDGLTLSDSDRAQRLDELQARINICNRAKADLLVSMHLNGFPDQSAGGYETWYNASREFHELNRRFATLAFFELGKQYRAAGYNAFPRRINDDSTAHASIGMDAFENYVITGPAHPGQIEPSAMPGAIVEALFISNHDDAAFMATGEGINAIVSGYEHAIVSYFDETIG